MTIPVGPGFGNISDPPGIVVLFARRILPGKIIVEVPALWVPEKCCYAWSVTPSLRASVPGSLWTVACWFVGSNPGQRDAIPGGISVLCENALRVRFFGRVRKVL